MPLISKNLEKTNSKREFLIKNNRETVILCSQAIISIHKNDLNTAKKKIEKARSELTKFIVDAKAMPVQRNSIYTKFRRFEDDDEESGRISLPLVTGTGD